MSTLRLTFLYPHLFRLIRVSEPTASTTRQCFHRLQSRRRATFASTHRKDQRFVQRHGKAVEPLLRPGETEDNTKVFIPETTKQSVKESSRMDKSDTKETNLEQTSRLYDSSSSSPLSEETQAAALLPGDTMPVRTTADETASQELSSREKAVVNTASPDAPLDTILHMDPPSKTPAEDQSIPHMHAPPYVHHFDSYTLVKCVEQGGFTPEQAITSMKAVRGLLALYLDVAKEGLVSKSDVENESYLFRAACSELRTEIQNTRKASEETMRRERTLLQHEVDILNQKLTQELLRLKDDLTSMFNDRKMDVRMEQRSMDSAIQGLHYQITVSLNSDSKSEVEGLRWVLTRRSVLAIVMMALMVLLSLRYASYRAHEEEVKRKEQEKIREQEAKQRAHHRVVEMADGETQTDGNGQDLSGRTEAETLTAN